MHFEHINICTLYRSLDFSETAGTMTKQIYSEHSSTSGSSKNWETSQNAQIGIPGIISTGGGGGDSGGSSTSTTTLTPAEINNLQNLQTISGLYSSSSSVTQGLKQTVSKRSESMFTVSSSSLYTVPIFWDTLTENDFTDTFLDELNKLNNIIYNEFETIGNYSSEIQTAIVHFIGIWGTHVLGLGKFGSFCREETFFESGSFYQQYQSTVYSASDVTGGYSNNVIKPDTQSDWDTSAVEDISTISDIHSSINQETEESSSSTLDSEGTSENSMSYQFHTSYCVGSVNSASMCGNIYGIYNDPSLISYELQPIYNLNILNANTSLAIYYVLNRIYFGGIGLCGGIAIPAANYDFWHYSENFLFWNLNNTNSSYGDMWDESKCFDQFYLGYLGVYSNDDNTTNTTNSTLSALSIYTTYKRKKYVRISGGILCHDGLDEGSNIALSLMSIKQNTTIGIELTAMYTRSFKAAFWIAPKQVTTFAFGHYFILCNDIESYMYSDVLNVETSENFAEQHNTTDFTGVYGDLYNITLKDKLSDTCGESENYNVVVGWKDYKHPVRDISSYGITADVWFKENDKFGIFVYEWFGQSIQESSIQFIVFCNTDRILASGRETFTNDDFNDGQGTLPATSRKEIKFDQGPCKHIRVWTGIATVATSCSVVISTEYLEPTSFQLSASVWDDTQDGCVLMSVTAESIVRVDYLVVCSGI